MDMGEGVSTEDVAILPECPQPQILPSGMNRWLPAVFVPARDRASTKTEKVGLYQHFTCLDKSEPEIKSFPKNPIRFRV